MTLHKVPRLSSLHPFPLYYPFFREVPTLEFGWETLTSNRVNVSLETSITSNDRVIPVPSTSQIMERGQSVTNSWPRPFGLRVRERRGKTCFCFGKGRRTSVGKVSLSWFLRHVFIYLNWNPTPVSWLSCMSSQTCTQLEMEIWTGLSGRDPGKDA